MHIPHAGLAVRTPTYSCRRGQGVNVHTQSRKYARFVPIPQKMWFQKHVLEMLGFRSVRRAGVHSGSFRDTIFVFFNEIEIAHDHGQTFQRVLHIGCHLGRCLLALG